MVTLRSALCALLFSMLLYGCAGSPAQTPPTLTPDITQSDNVLFLDPAGDGRPVISDDPAVIRHRLVVLNPDLLENARAGDVVVLNAFEDAVFEMVLADVKRSSSDLTWIGQIPGELPGEVIIVVGGGQASSSISLSDTFYQVRHVEADVHAIYEIDRSAFPDEDEP